MLLALRSEKYFCFLEVNYLSLSSASACSGRKYPYTVPLHRMLSDIVRRKEWFQRPKDLKVSMNVN